METAANPFRWHCSLSLFNYAVSAVQHDGLNEIASPCEHWAMEITCSASHVVADLLLKLNWTWEPKMLTSSPSRYHEEATLNPIIYQTGCGPRHTSNHWGGDRGDVLWQTDTGCVSSSVPPLGSLK